MRRYAPPHGRVRLPAAESSDLQIVRVPAVEARRGHGARTPAHPPPGMLGLPTLRAACAHLVGAAAVPGTCRGADAVATRGAQVRVSRSASCGRATLLLRYLVRVHRFSVTIGGQTYSVRARWPRSALRKALGQYTEEPSARAGPLTATVQRKGGAPQTLSGVLSLRVSAHGKIEDWDFHW